MVRLREDIAFSDQNGARPGKMWGDLGQPWLTQSEDLGKVQYYFTACGTGFLALDYDLNPGRQFPSSLSDNKRVCKYRWLEMFNCLKHY